MRKAKKRLVRAGVIKGKFKGKSYGYYHREKKFKAGDLVRIIPRKEWSDEFNKAYSEWQHITYQDFTIGMNRIAKNGTVCKVIDIDRELGITLRSADGKKTYDHYYFPVFALVKYDPSRFFIREGVLKRRIRI